VELCDELAQVLEHRRAFARTFLALNRVYAEISLKSVAHKGNTQFFFVYFSHACLPIVFKIKPITLLQDFSVRTLENLLKNHVLKQVFHFLFNLNLGETGVYQPLPNQKIHTVNVLRLFVFVEPLVALDLEPLFPVLVQIVLRVVLQPKQVPRLGRVQRKLAELLQVIALHFFEVLPQTLRAQKFGRAFSAELLPIVELALRVTHLLKIVVVKYLPDHVPRSRPGCDLNQHVDSLK
jgi:hypothetical protein